MTREGTVEGGVNDDLREGRRASRDDDLRGRSRRRDSREESTNLGVDDEIQGRSRRISKSTTRFEGRRASRENEQQTSRENSENPRPRIRLESDLKEEGGERGRERSR
ncbi:uncharacterized protein A4U43_C08F16380 [Asparagus officinalis]|nr:uncharacterized protein A4U43_C08F16380 [Asparagus officinalis]